MGKGSRATPLLLTPGPLTTSAETKAAMDRDWGSRDDDFIELNARIRRRILDIANAGDAFEYVPVQGSGTFGVEAALGTLIPPDGKVLVLVNGSYGRRMVRILEIMGRSLMVLQTPEDALPDLDRLDETLAGDDAITHVAVVHCETTSGILNPVAKIAEVVVAHKRRLIIDAMSAFGGIPLDSRDVMFDALVASSNKCLEGVPGVAFAIVRRRALEAAGGNAHSLALDLHDQWQAMQKNGQWRFTPPVQVLAAFDAALEQFEREGGTEGRNRRYAEICRVLVDGMAELGFRPFLAAKHQAPIIVTFRNPADSAWNFDRFYEGLKARGFVIYPGKLTEKPSFRIGCIGHLNPADMQGAVAAVREVMADMGLASGAPGD